MKAKKKPLEELELDDLDLEEDDVEAKTKQLKSICLLRKMQEKCYKASCKIK